MSTGAAVLVTVAILGGVALFALTFTQVQLVLSRARRRRKENP